MSCQNYSHSVPSPNNKNMTHIPRSYTLVYNGTRKHCHCAKMTTFVNPLWYCIGNHEQMVDSNEYFVSFAISHLSSWHPGVVKMFIWLSIWNATIFSDKNTPNTIRPYTFDFARYYLVYNFRMISNSVKVNCQSLDLKFSTRIGSTAGEDSAKFQSGTMI